MKAVRIPAANSPLDLTTVDDPVPSTNQLLLQIAACAVCYRDLVDRAGRYPFMRFPIITGHEFAGTVLSVGPDVREWRPGDRVVTTHRPACGDCDFCRAGEETRCTGSPISYGLTVDGGYAEKVLAWSASLVRVPDRVPLDEAAFLHCTAAVALRALRHQAQLRAGETVVVSGATGGVGVHAVQVAKLLGARVLAVTSSAAKIDALRAATGLAADEVLLAPPDGRFDKEVLTRTGGADVALDLVGAPTFNASMRSLRAGGRVVLVGNVTGERLEVNPGWLIVREVSVVGSSGASRADVAEVLSWVEAGRLRPVVADRLPLADAAAAQERLQHKSVVGRILLVP